MKIPSEIIVKKAKYQVVMTNTMDFDDEVYGLCDPQTRVILIKKHMTKRQTLATFIHEVLHAIEFEYGFTLGHKIINPLEHPLTDFIRHNFGIFL